MIVAVTDAGGRMLWVEGDPRLRTPGGRHELRRGRALGRGRRRHQRPRHRARRRPRRPDLRQRALPPPRPAVELLGRAGARPVHRRAAGRHRRDRRRPRRQPARAHPGARHRRGGRVGAALAAREQLQRGAGRRPPAAAPAGPAAGGAGPGAGAADPAVRPARAVAAALRAARCCSPRPPSRARAAPPRSWPPSAIRATPPRSPSAPSCPGCAGWSAPTSSARAPTGCSAGSRPTWTRCAGCWPAARSARRWSAIPARCCPAPSAPGVAAPASGWPRCCARRCCAAAVPSCCCATPSCPEARDDAAVWQACLEWLPAELAAPRRRGRAPAAAAARLTPAADRAARGNARDGRPAFAAWVSRPVLTDRPCRRCRAPAGWSPRVVALALGGLRDRHHRVRHHGAAPRHRRRRRASTSPRPGTSSPAYALGVVVGAPVIAALGARLPRRALLVGLMAAFLVGNALSALAPGYRTLLVARFLERPAARRLLRRRLAGRRLAGGAAPAGPRGQLGACSVWRRQCSPACRRRPGSASSSAGARRTGRSSCWRRSPWPPSLAVVPSPPGGREATVAQRARRAAAPAGAPHAARRRRRFRRHVRPLQLHRARSSPRSPGCRAATVPLVLLVVRRRRRRRDGARRPAGRLGAVPLAGRRHGRPRGAARRDARSPRRRRSRSSRRSSLVSVRASALVVCLQMRLMEIAGDAQMLGAALNHSSLNAGQRARRVARRPRHRRRARLPGAERGGRRPGRGGPLVLALAGAAAARGRDAPARPGVRRRPATGPRRPPELPRCNDAATLRDAARALRRAVPRRVRTFRRFPAPQRGQLRPGLLVERP